MSAYSISIMRQAVASECGARAKTSGAPNVYSVMHPAHTPSAIYRPRHHQRLSSLQRIDCFAQEHCKYSARQIPPRDNNARSNMDKNDRRVPSALAPSPSTATNNSQRRRALHRWSSADILRHAIRGGIIHGKTFAILLTSSRAHLSEIHGRT